MHESSDPLQLLFQALCKPQPAVQVVITAGTWIEYCLHRLLRNNLPFPDLLGNPDRAGIPYTPLVRLTSAMAVIPSDLRECLIGFGHIRNRFAHDIETILDDQQLATFTRSFPQDILKMLPLRPADMLSFQ